MHYTTLGSPHRNAAGEIDNAVMVLHGTGRRRASNSCGRNSPTSCTGPGQPLDIRRYWIILPDNIGHGKSSKPSDGLRMKFPKYDYDDMVEAQHRMLIEGLGVTHLRLIMGTSMGCMHALRLGRDLSRFRQRADAAGLRADRDCRAQPNVAAAGDRRDRDRIRHGKAAITPAEPLAGPADRAESCCSSPASAPLYYQAQYPTRDAAERLMPRSASRTAIGRARRQRPDLSARFIAELQSVAEAGADQGADDVDQFGRRFHQSAQPRRTRSRR